MTAIEQAIIESPNWNQTEVFGTLREQGLEDQAAWKRMEELERQWNARNFPQQKPAEVKQAKDKPPVEYPPGVPCAPWSKLMPRVSGYTWHGKLWKKLNCFTRVMVLMAQLAELDREERIKAGTWDGVYRCFASRKYLAKFCICSESNIKRYWRQLIAIGWMSRGPGTGKSGATSQWVIYGLREPETGGVRVNSDPGSNQAT